MGPVQGLETVFWKWCFQGGPNPVAAGLQVSTVPVVVGLLVGKVASFYESLGEEWWMVL